MYSKKYLVSILESIFLFCSKKIFSGTTFTLKGALKRILAFLLFTGAEKNNSLSRYYFMRSCKAIFCISCLFFVLFFSISSLAAESVIEDVRFQKNGDGSESVIFQLSRPSLPKAFALQGEKPRVVFDFMNTQLFRAVPSVLTANGAMVEKIRMGRYSDKVRVVLDLTMIGSVNFEQNFDEQLNILTIKLFSTEYPAKDEEPLVETVVPAVAQEEIIETVEVVETIEVAEVPEVVVAEEVVSDYEPQGAEVVASVDVVDNPLIPEALLSAVSFENTSNKGEMVLFKLNGFYPPEVTGEEKGTPKVICVFTAIRLGDEVVTEQIIPGKYIKKISVLPMNSLNSIQVVMELAPNKNYDLQQVFFKEDNLFVVIVNSYDAMAAPAE